MKQKDKRRLFHLKRTGLFAIVFIAFLIVRFDAGALPASLQTKVLAYATDMSVSGLLSGTNTARTAQGLPPLTLNGRLNTSAQQKAADMAAKNYWAHVSPDGTQPWYFFDQAGYAYSRAGENLAYGFSTSQGAIDGWMNSPTHRANLLGDYRDVGFGIINVPDYQSSGEQTIVVAHYGTEAKAAPTPVAPVAPTTSAPPATTAVPESPTPPAPSPDTATPEAAQPAPTTTRSTPNQNAITPKRPVATGNETEVTVLSMIANKNLPLAAILSLALVGFAVAGFALTHRSAFVHAISTGEHFVVRHPGIDAAAMAALTSLILLTTYGTLR